MEYKNVNSGFGYVVRLEKGEKVVASLTQLAEQENITSAFFYGLGAVENITIGYFDTEQSDYVYQEIADFHELASVNGNIALRFGKPFVHMHGVIADTSLVPLAGHIQEAEVAGTCELFIHLQHGVEMVREDDEGSGLSLLHFK